MGYSRDLLAVPKAFRDPLRAYVEEGVVPKDRALYAILVGDIARAIEIEDPHSDIGEVLYFLRIHVSHEAWGTPERVQRWVWMHGQFRKHDRRH